MAWPFKRRDAGDEGPAPTSEAVDDAPAPTPEPAALSAPPADPGWRSLPPMPLATPVLAPLVQRKATVDALSSWHAPALSLAPLGHALDADGPSGRIGTALAEPLVASPPAVADGGAPAAPPLSYVQRAPAEPTSSVRRWSAPTTPQLHVSAAPPSAPLSLLEAPAPPVPTRQLEPLAPPEPLALPTPVVQRAPEDDVAPAEAPAEAPLLGDVAPPSAAPDVTPPAALPTALDLPLAPGLPLQRQAEEAEEAEEHHPGDGHDHGDEAQRAPLHPTEPAAVTASTVPLLGEPIVPPAVPEAVAPTTPTSPAAETAPAALPLTSPVQRRADSPTPPRRAGLGAPLARPPAATVEPPAVIARDALPVLADVQRSAADQDEPAAPAPVAPLLGSSALRPSLVEPEPVAAPDHSDHDHADDEDHGALPLAQRAAEGAAPAPAEDVEGDLATAPLLGSADAPLATTGAPGLDPLIAADTSTDGTAVTSSAVDLPLAHTAADAPGTSDLSPASLPLAAAQRAAATGSATAPTAALPALPPLVVSPLLGGRPFAVSSLGPDATATVQRAAVAAGAATGTPATASTAAAAAASNERLSPGAGVYDPVLPLAVWNGAATPSLPAGPGPDAPPGDVVATVQRSTGVDLSNVRIRRDTGPTVQRMQAKALTHDEEVHLPEERGDLQSAENRSLVAHELVHVAQQRTLGSSRPLEATPGGQHLELQAQAMEHSMLHGGPTPALALHTPTAPAVQRAAEHSSPAPATSPFTASQLSSLLSLADNPPTSAVEAPHVQRSVDPSLSAPQVQRSLVEDTPTTPTAAMSAPGGRGEDDLEELANQLFPRIRSRLRRELRSDRERHGSLTDLHR